MINEEQKSLAPWDIEEAENVIENDVVVEEQQPETEPTTEPEPKQEEAKPTPPPAWTPEDVAAAYAKIEEQKASKTKPAEPPPPALTEEEFNAKYRPKQYTDEEIAAEMDWDPELDQKKIRGFRNLLNQATQNAYQKAIQAADLVQRDEIAKIKASYDPVVQEVNQYKQKQATDFVANKIVTKYPALGQAGIRDYVSLNYATVLQRHASKTFNNQQEYEALVEAFVDDLATTTAEQIKKIKPDFDPKQKSEPLSQTNKTPSPQKQVNKPASVSMGGQSGVISKEPAKEKASKFNLFDTIG